MTIAAPLNPAMTDDRTAAVVAGRGRWTAAVQARWFGAVLLAVLLVDQATKAWAWRRLELVHIDSGTGLLFGDEAGRWYRDPLLGPLLDVAAISVLAGLTGLLLLRPRPAVPFLGGALVLAGWASNLADRVALHSYTAPGSRRGVVDFLRWGGRLWNLADVTIIIGGALLLASVPLLLWGRGRCLPSTGWSSGSTAPSRVWEPAPAFASSPASGPAAPSGRSPM